MEPSSDTTNLFRPNQVTEAKAELRALNDMLRQDNPARAKISDPREMRKRAKRLGEDIQKYEPKAYASSEKDAAVREFRELGQTIKAGMPSSTVMRSNPPGAVEQHIAWEKRSKPLINRWKHLGLRLEAGGDVPPEMNIPGASINIEVLRDLKASHDLSLDGSQVKSRTSDFHIGSDPAGTVIFTDEEEAALKELAPAVAASLGTLPNEARAELKALVGRAMQPADDIGQVIEASAPAAASVEKPGPADLSFNEMKSMGAKAGFKVFGMTKSDLMTALRSRRLIR